VYLNKKICALVVAATLALTGCKAKTVEMDLSADDVAAAVAGEQVMVDFEATFENVGQLDPEKRAQVTEAENLLRQHMTIEGFELETTQMGFKITISGSLPVAASSDAPYYIQVANSDTLAGYTRVQLAHGKGFNAMSKAIQRISFMLKPDAFHPTKIKWKGKGRQIIAPGVEVNGTGHLLYSGNDQGRVSLTFKDGVFDKIGAGFFVAQ
jgi:hypothetical protein